jgi:hypothetical protein
MRCSKSILIALAALLFGAATAYSDVPRIKTRDWTFEALGGRFGVQEYEIPWLPSGTPPRFETEIHFGSFHYSFRARAPVVVGSAIGSLLLISVVMAAFIRQWRIHVKTVP